MIPRLTKRGRYFASRDFIGPRQASRPSPAEQLRLRRKARAAFKRNAKKIDSARWHLFLHSTWTPPDLPQSRGTIACEHCHIMARIRRGDVSAFASGIECYPECTCNSGIGKLPQSRGTTTSQLVAMHLEAESENDR